MDGKPVRWADLVPLLVEQAGGLLGLLLGALQLRGQLDRELVGQGAANMVSGAIGSSVDELVDLLCRGLAASYGSPDSSKDPS